MIVIPVGERHRSTAEAAVWRATLCSRCQASYAFLAIASGRGAAENLLYLNAEKAVSKASAAATEAARRRASEMVSPFPCPHCGAMQAMLPADLQKQLISAALFRSPAVIVLGLLLGLVIMFTAIEAWPAINDSELGIPLCLASGVLFAAGVRLGWLWLGTLKTGRTPSWWQPGIGMSEHYPVCTREQYDGLVRDGHVEELRWP